jgi:hypothetical protein
MARIVGGQPLERAYERVVDVLLGSLPGGRSSATETCDAPQPHGTQHCQRSTLAAAAKRRESSQTARHESSSDAPSGGARRIAGMFEPPSGGAGLRA